MEHTKVHRDILLQNAIQASVYLECHEEYTGTQIELLNEYAMSFKPVTKADVLQALENFKQEVEGWE